MKNITVQTIDHEGNKIEETKVQIEDQEILIVKLPEKTSMEEAKKLHDVVTLGLKLMAPVIAIPESIKFQVLKIGDTNAE